MIRSWALAAALCGCKSTPATESSPPPPRDARPAPALPIPAPAFDVPAPADPVVDLSQSDRSVCAVRKSGHVDCWGDGPVIVRLPGIADATKVRAGGTALCALRPSEITCFFTIGKLDVSDPLHVPIAGALDAVVAGTNCAVRPDHRVACWNLGDDSVTPVRGLRDVATIAGNGVLTCGTHLDGKVTCTDEYAPADSWRPVALDHVQQLVLGEGNSDNGDFYVEGAARFFDGSVRLVSFSGHAPRRIHIDKTPALPSLHGATALAMRGTDLIAVVGGKVIVTSADKPVQTLAKLTDAVGATASCAVRAQGSVVCWGNTLLGQPRRDEADQPVTVRGVADVISVATNATDSWAVTRDGHVFHWGNDQSGWAVPLAEAHGTTAVALAVVPCFLRRTGGVTCLSRTNAPVDLKLDHVVELRSDQVRGYSGFLARTADGTVLHWLDGSVGDPDFKPTVMPRVPEMVQLVADPSNVCARDRVGAVWCGKPNAALQRIAIPPAKQLASAAEAVCALVESGQVWCWGDNSFGQLGRGSREMGSVLGPGLVPGVDHVVAIGGADIQLCAERADGSLTCWGTVGDDLKPFAMLPAGSLDGPFVGGVNGCAIRKDGLVACWGGNAHGRLGDGSVMNLDVPAAVPGLH